jgi:hypothetical protein
MPLQNMLKSEFHTTQIQACMTIAGLGGCWSEPICALLEAIVLGDGAPWFCRACAAVALTSCCSVPARLAAFAATLGALQQGYLADARDDLPMTPHARETRVAADIACIRHLQGTLEGHAIVCAGRKLPSTH